MSDTTRFTSCGSSENLRTSFNALRDQVEALHDAIDGIVAKLDGDAGITDTDYESLWAPAADASFDLTED